MSPGEGWPSVAGHPQNLEKGRADSPLESSEGAWPCRYPGFELMTSQTVSEPVSVVLRHSVCGRDIWYVNARILGLKGQLGHHLQALLCYGGSS